MSDATLTPFIKDSNKNIPIIKDNKNSKKKSVHTVVLENDKSKSTLLQENKIPEPSFKEKNNTKLFTVGINKWMIYLKNLFASLFYNFGFQFIPIALLLSIFYIDLDLIFWSNIILQLFIILVLLRGLFPIRRVLSSKRKYPSVKQYDKTKKSSIGKEFSSSKVKFKRLNLGKFYSNITKRFKNYMKNMILNYVNSVEINKSGTETYKFDIYQNDKKLRFEMDTGTLYTICDLKYFAKHVPNYKDFFHSKLDETLHTASGHVLQHIGLFKIPFYLPKYGDINLNVVLATNAYKGCFLVGREFIKQTKLSIIYSEKIKGVVLEYNKESTPILRINDSLTLQPYETKTIIGKVSNSKKGNYIVKNNAKSNLIYEHIKTENEKFFVKATNKLDIPISQHISSLTLIRKDEFGVFKNTFKDICFDYYLSRMLYLYITRVNKFLLKIYHELLKNQHFIKVLSFCKRFINVVNKYYYESIYFRFIMETFKEKMYEINVCLKVFVHSLLSFVQSHAFLILTFVKDFLIKSQKSVIVNNVLTDLKPEKDKVLTDLKQEHETVNEEKFLNTFKHDESLGVDISEVLHTKQLNLTDIKNQINCQIDSVKDRVANLLYDMNIYSRHTFDCGALNEKIIPKMSIRLNGPIYKNTKPYSLTKEDREQVNKFFDLLLENNFCSVATPDKSFGNPVFCVPSRSEDGSYLPRIIIDAKYSNTAALGGSSASLPDYKNLLGPIIQKAKYITTIDLKKCFYSILVDEESKNCGAMNVLTEKGAYIMNRALTGFCQTPSYLTQTFQKYLHENELGDLDMIQNLLVFMDDLILFSESEESLETHLLEIDKLFKRIQLIGVKLSPSKCHIAIDLDSDQEIHILGFKIKNRKFLCPDKKISQITNLGPPDTLKKLQSLLGKLNYYRSIFPLELHEQCNILYKKLSPFTYDSEAAKAFSKIQTILLNKERTISVIRENSVNILLTDASHYSIGSVLLCLDMSECVKNFQIPSFPFEGKLLNSFPKNEVEYIYFNTNLVKCILTTASKLNFKLIFEDMDSSLNLIYTYCKLNYKIIEYMPWLDKNTKKQYLSHINDELFTKKISELSLEYLLSNEYILNYLLNGISHLFKINVHLVTPCSEIQIGNFKESLYFYISDCTVYGLNVINHTKYSKTRIRFGPNMMTQNEFKQYFLNILLKNTYDENEKLISIISYFSKAIPFGHLEKLGIAYLELYSVYESLIHFEDYISNRTTYVLLDNIVVKCLLSRNKYNIRSTKLDNLSNKIYMWYKDTPLYFIHVTDKQNLADVWSRLCKVEISTLNNAIKPYYTDQTMTIAKFQIKDPDIKNIPTNVKFPYPGKFFANKFRELLSTENFIKLQMKEKHVTDMVPNSLKYKENKIILPITLYLPFICFFHYSLGHLGSQRLWNYVQQNYFLNNKKVARMICDNLCASCVICIQNKPSNIRLKEGSAYKNDISGPNQLIYSDLLEFPTFESHVKNLTGNSKALLVFQDVYSSYITVYILQQKTSQAIKNCLANYFSVHDISKAFVSDNAKIYQSNMIKNYFNDLGVKVHNSSVMKSKSRGFIERSMRKLNEMLRFYRKTYTSLDISHILSISCAMLNKVPFHKEKLSPYNLQYMSVSGINDGSIYMPNENIFDYEIELDQELGQTLSDYKKELHEMIKDCRSRVINIKMQNLEKRNKKRINHNILRGDYVIIKTFDRGYEKKYRPIFGLILYKVLKSKDIVLFLENTLSGQVVMRHVTDCRKIDFEKLSKLEVSKNLADSFELLTLTNLNKIFDIQPLSNRKIKPDAETLELLDKESSSDDDTYDHEDNDKEALLPTIIE